MYSLYNVDNSGRSRPSPHLNGLLPVAVHLLCVTTRDVTQSVRPLCLEAVQFLGAGGQSLARLSQLLTET